MAKMMLRCLFVQRKESYEGQHAPELISTVDEYSYSENPEAFDAEFAENLKDVLDDIVGHSIIWIQVDQQEIRNRCISNLAPLPGIIV